MGEIHGIVTPSATIVVTGTLSLVSYSRTTLWTSLSELFSLIRAHLSTPPLLDAFSPNSFSTACAVRICDEHEALEAEHA